MAANVRRVLHEGRKFFSKCSFNRQIKSTFVQKRFLTTAQSSEQTTHFGFETVTEEEKTEKGAKFMT